MFIYPRFNPHCTARITLNVASFPTLSPVTLQTGTASPTRLLQPGATKNETSLAYLNPFFCHTELPVPSTTRFPAWQMGPVLLSLSSLKFLLKSLRNLGCRFVLRGMWHMLLHLGMRRDNVYCKQGI